MTTLHTEECALTMEEIDHLEVNICDVASNIGNEHARFLAALAIKVCAAARLSVCGQAASECEHGHTTIMLGLFCWDCGTYLTTPSEAAKQATLRDEPIAEEQTVWDMWKIKEHRDRFLERTAPPPSGVSEQEKCRCVIPDREDCPEPPPTGCYYREPTFFGDFLQTLGEQILAAAASCRCRDSIAIEHVKLAEKLEAAERELARLRGLPGIAECEKRFASLEQERDAIRAALKQAEGAVDAMFHACAVQRAELGDNWTQITRVREIGFAHRRARAALTAHGEGA